MNVRKLARQYNRTERKLVKVLVRLEDAGVVRLGDRLRRTGRSAPMLTKEELSQMLLVLRNIQNSNQGVRPVHRPPGWQLRNFAAFVFSRKVYTLVLEPTLADIEAEHFDALAAGRLWRARIVLIRGYISFWSAVAAQLPVSLARRAFELWKATNTR